MALAHVNVGAFSNDDAMLDRVLKAAKAQGEKTWHLPVDEEYREMLKSTFADIPNIASRFWRRGRRVCRCGRSCIWR